MALLDWRRTVAGWLGYGEMPESGPAPVAYRAAVNVGRVGRPGYASGLGSFGTLPREQSLQMMAQFYAGIPVYKRAIQILVGFCGMPLFEGDEAAVKDLIEWSTNVQYGRIGRGLGAWQRDYLGQCLKYGYGVGEAEIGAARKEVSALWVYRSPTCGFKSNEFGELEIIQQQAGRGMGVTLNPETTVLTVNDPEGCDPNGQPLFMACPTFAQIWLEVASSYRSTWRRCGIPVFHIHTRLPDTLDDPEGEIASEVNSAVEAQWNAGIKSQVVDGRAQDFFTASTGEASVKTVGSDGQLIDIQIAKRNIVEELVVATGIPPWMLGYSWSTTERLSTQQADTLLAWIDCMRAAATPGLRQIIELRQRLAGKRGKVSLRWPDVNLQDLTETATAALNEARALESKEKVATSLWRNGVFDQAAYAEFVTGEAGVVTAMTEPFVSPTPFSDSGGDGSGPGNDGGQQQNGLRLPPLTPELRAKILAEADAEYPGLGRCAHNNGKGGH